MKQKKSTKRLYLDVCTLCRPFDDQFIWKQMLSISFCSIFRMACMDLIVSPAHIAEINAFKEIKERIEVSELLKRFEVKTDLDIKKIRTRADELILSKFGVADAAHVAFAEASADFFISCDDKLLKKCKRNKIDVIAVNPVEFTIREDLK